MKNNSELLKRFVDKIKKELLSLIVEAKELFSNLKDTLATDASLNKKSLASVNVIQKTTLKFKLAVLLTMFLGAGFLFAPDDTSHTQANGSATTNYDKIDLKNALISGEYYLVSGIRIDEKPITCNEVFEDKYKNTCEKPRDGKCDIKITSLKDNYYRFQDYTWSDQSNAYLRKALSPGQIKPFKELFNSKFESFNDVNGDFQTYYEPKNVTHGYGLREGQIVEDLEPQCIGNCDSSVYETIVKSHKIMTKNGPYLQKLCKNDF